QLAARRGGPVLDGVRDREAGARAGLASPRNRLAREGGMTRALVTPRSQESSMNTSRVPYFRPDIGDGEIAEVCATLRSGWLTTGPKVHRFEEAFKAAVHARHALAVNSCTSALHLALEAVGTTRGDGVLVPTMTFAATAEVVR